VNLNIVCAFSSQEVKRLEEEAAARKREEAARRKEEEKKRKEEEKEKKRKIEEERKQEEEERQRLVMVFVVGVQKVIRYHLQLQGISHVGFFHFHGCWTLHLVFGLPTFLPPGG
jgi:cation transport ATPase